MKLKSLRPIIWTKEFEATIDFYTNILEFSIGEKNENWSWASLFKDEVEIMISKPIEPSDFEKPIFTGSFYFNTDNVEELWNRLKNKTHVCYELETFEWQMREFAIYDNNGYILQFGEEV